MNHSKNYFSALTYIIILNVIQAIQKIIIHQQNTGCHPKKMAEGHSKSSDENNRHKKHCITSRYAQFFVSIFFMWGFRRFLGDFCSVRVSMMPTSYMYDLNSAKECEMAIAKAYTYAVLYEALAILALCSNPYVRKK